jgi:hypothetical protein
VIAKLYDKTIKCKGNSHLTGVGARVEAINSEALDDI